MTNTITRQAKELELDIQRTNYQLGLITKEELQQFYFKNFISLHDKYHEKNPA